LTPLGEYRVAEGIDPDDAAGMFPALQLPELPPGVSPRSRCERD